MKLNLFNNKNVKGKYRVLPKFDLETKDFPEGDDFDDFYISCQRPKGAEIYWTSNNKTDGDVLEAFIPSWTIHEECVETLGDKAINHFSNRPDTPSLTTPQKEGFVSFRAEDIDLVAKVLRPNTSGASIRPTSKRNIPKHKKVYKTYDKMPKGWWKSVRPLGAQIAKNEGLKLSKLWAIVNADFAKSIKQPNLAKDADKANYKFAHYVHQSGQFNEYLSYIKNRAEGEK